MVDLEEHIAQPIGEQIEEQIEEPVLPPIDETIVAPIEEASFFGPNCNRACCVEHVPSQTDALLLPCDVAEHVLALTDVPVLPCDDTEHVLGTVCLSFQGRLGVHDRRMGNDGRLNFRHQSGLPV